MLLFGETGTGKEIIARAVHEHSTFRNGPFRRVNCGAIAPELIDSELFGHEQGAFTGAVTRRKGWFEQADGGTLFLDEVGELALAAQVRLLRVVQDGEVIRVGGERRSTSRFGSSLPRIAICRRWSKCRPFAKTCTPSVGVSHRHPPAPRPPQRHPRVRRVFRRARRQPIRSSTRAGLGRRCARARRVSMAGKRPRDGGGDGPRRPDRPGAGARRGRRPRPGHAEREPAAGPCLRTRSIASIEPLDVVIRRHIEAALDEAHGRVEGPHGAARMLRVNPHTLRARMRKLKIDWRSFRAASRH